MTESLSLFTEGVWGLLMIRAASMTLLVAICAYIAGLVIGTVGAIAKLSGVRPAALIAEGYTTVVRGVPELLIIYLIFFGGSIALSYSARIFGLTGRFEMSPFVAGVVAIAIICGAYATEIVRGAILAVGRGQVEAARAFGFSKSKRLRRVILPQAARHALPGLGNLWIVILKLTSLISVTGLVEVMRQAGIGYASTRQAFAFYLAAALIYILLTGSSAVMIKMLEMRVRRGVRSS